MFPCSSFNIKFQSPPPPKEGTQQILLLTLQGEQHKIASQLCMTSSNLILLFNIVKLLNFLYFYLISHALTFNHSSFISLSISIFSHGDVWGPASTSMRGPQYYIAFVDFYAWYIWVSSLCISIVCFIHLADHQGTGDCCERNRHGYEWNRQIWIRTNRERASNKSRTLNTTKVRDEAAKLLTPRSPKALGLSNQSQGNLWQKIVEENLWFIGCLSLWMYIHPFGKL